MALPRVVLVPLIVACGQFMEQIDSTVLATSLPMIARDLHENPIALKLALTSYLLSLAIFIPVSGWFADKFGTRTVFRSAICVFVGGSILCGLSGTLPGFVAARFVQGIGGAMMVPVGRMLVLRSVSKIDLVRALNYLTIPALLGPVIGPLLGGFITTYLNWRWIFFINVPISIVGIYLTNRFIDNIKEEQIAPLDWLGFLLSAVGLSLVMIGLSTAGRHLVSGAVSFWCCVAGVPVLIAYWQHSKRVAHPLLALDLFKVQTFRIGVWGGSLFRVAYGSIPFLLPLMLQLGFGMSPFQAGMLTFVSAFGSMFMKSLAQRVLRRTGFRQVMLINGLVSSAVLGSFGLFTAQTPHLLILAVLLLSGCIFSLQFTSVNALSYADIEQSRVGQAASIGSVVQQVSLGMGITAGALALQGSNWIQGHATIVAADFGPAFWVVALVGASSVFVFRAMDANAGAEVTGRQVSSKPAA